MAKGKEGLELQKERLIGLGEDPVIKAEKLSIEPNDYLEPIKNDPH